MMLVNSTIDRFYDAGKIEIIKEMVKDPDPEVRLEIAQLEPWQSALHQPLIEDSDEKVREELARREDLPSSAIKNFVQDPSEPVRVNIARYSRLDKTSVEKMLKDPSPEVRRTLVFSTVGNLQVRILEELSNDPEEMVRWQVAFNASTPKAVLHKLSTDSSQQVREAAIDSLDVSQQ
jgi:HEAT repeat protein